MVRKYLFIGMMIMLATIVVWMVMRTREQEKRAAAEAVELVKSVQTTPARAFAPEDLRIVESAMQTSPSPLQTAAPTLTASHRVVIQNVGAVPYGKVLLDFSYVGPDGKVLQTKKHLLTGKPIAPGQALTVSGIVIEGVPRGTARSETRITWAEIERTGPSGAAK